MSNAKNGSTRKLTHRKSRAQKHVATLETSYPTSTSAAKTEVSRYRQKSGATFEREISNRLLVNGIAAVKKTVTVEDGLKKISDHYFVGKNNKYWIESTTCLTTQPRVEEFINKKKLVQEQDPSIKNWVIFFRKDPRQKEQSAKSIANYARQFKKAGIVFCNGDAEIDEYITSIIETEEMPSRPIIRVAKVMSIPLSRIKPNRLNRDLIPDSINTLKLNIVLNGFVTQINVVPESINGRLTGYYIAFEGHNRLEALNQLVAMKMEFESGGDDPLIPCVVCDWLTSEDKKQVANLLCKTNTTYRKWQTKNYIKFHYDTSSPQEIDIPDMHFSYDVLRWMMKKETRKTLVFDQDNEQEILGETYLLYVYGPKKSSTATSFFLDNMCIHEGEYLTEAVEFKMMKKFHNEVLLPFHFWLRESKRYDNLMLRRFMAGLYENFKECRYSFKYAKMVLEIFKDMKNPPIREKEVNEEFWGYIDGELSKLTMQNSKKSVVEMV